MGKKYKICKVVGSNLTSISAVFSIGTLNGKIPQSTIPQKTRTVPHSSHRSWSPVLVNLPKVLNNKKYIFYMKIQ
jgi:hypothetical protein